MNIYVYTEETRVPYFSNGFQNSVTVSPLPRAENGKLLRKARLGAQEGRHVCRSDSDGYPVPRLMTKKELEEFYRIIGNIK